MQLIENKCVPKPRIDVCVYLKICNTEYPNLSRVLLIKMRHTKMGSEITTLKHLRKSPLKKWS